MKNNIFGKDDSLYKKLIYRRVLCCILSFLLLLVLNILILIIRHEIGKTLSIIMNIILDIFVLTGLMVYYDFKVSNDLIILNLYKQKKHIFSGSIEKITTTSIMYNKLECYTVIIDGKRYYSPINSKIYFILDKSAVISVVKEIILEVTYE